MNRRGWAFFRMALGVFTLMVLLFQVLRLNGNSVFVPLNFFGYFTNLSNIFGSIVFIIGAVYLAAGKKTTPRDDMFRGAAVLYLLVTGVVYALLLRNEDLGLLMPWVNIVLHVIMPIAVIADWIIVPPKHPATVRQSLRWLVFPLVYLVYTLLRGDATGWYPYPFLNPHESGGYLAVAGICTAILVVFFGLSRFLLWLPVRFKNTSQNLLK